MAEKRLLTLPSKGAGRESLFSIGAGDAPDGPIVPPAEVAVTQKGTLQKMGRRFKLWASRYYEIQGQNMYYYKTAHSKHKCLGYVDLKVCYHVEVSDASTFGYAFEVHTIHRVHIFAARTAEDRDLWMKCISDLMGGKAVYEASKSLPKTKTGRRARSARRRTIDSIPSDIIQGSPHGTPSPESKKKGRKTVLSQSFKSTSRPTSSVEPSPLLSTRKAVTVEIKPKEPTPTPKEPTPTPKEPTPTPREPTPTPKEPTPTPKEPTPTPREPTPTPKEPTPTPKEPTPTPKEPCEIVVKPPTPELPSEEARSQPSPVETIGNGVIPQVAEIESAAVNQAFTAENGQLVGQTVPSEGTISEDSLEQQEVPSEEVPSEEAPSEAQTSVEEVKIATSNSQVSEAPVDPEVNTVKPLSASPMDRPKSPKARTGSPVFQRPATPSSPHVKPNKKISLANQLPQIPKTPQLPADVREYLSQHFVTDDIKDFLASLPEDEGSGEDIPLPEKYINHLSSNEHDSFPAMDGLRFFLADCA